MNIRNIRAIRALVRLHLGKSEWFYSTPSRARLLALYRALERAGTDWLILSTVRTARETEGDFWADRAREGVRFRVLAFCDIAEEQLIWEAKEARYWASVDVTDDESPSRLPMWA